MGYRPYPESQYEERPFHAGGRFPQQEPSLLQDGQLLANRIATHLRTDLELNTARHSLLLHDAMIDINGTKLGVKGTVRRDTAAQALDVDLQYGLHTPSLETVLHMIPESILKKAEVSAGGEVSFIGTLKGMYGKQKMPLATLDIRIKDAFARYAGLPYGIDKVNADFSARIDLMRNTPSCLNLKIFQFKGADTDILADMKVDNLLTDPDITFHTRSTVDLNTLTQIFPLQEGIGMEGKMNADLKLRCRLSTLKKQDWGRIKVQGKIRTDKLVLRHTQKNFEFTSNATLDFAGNEWLGGRVEIKDMTLRSPALNSATKLYGGNQHLSFPRHAAPCQDGMQDRDEQVEIPGGFARPLLRKIIRPPQAATRRAQPCQSADRAYTGSGHTVLPHGRHPPGNGQSRHRNNSRKSTRFAMDTQRHHRFPPHGVPHPGCAFPYRCRKLPSR